MLASMQLSIITINYNNALGLEKTLKSVNSQTCKDFEHIIIDGASTDGSVDVIRKYDDGTITRRWVSEKDGGIYNAMNKGIKMAHGDYVQILNSGDALYSDDVVKFMLDSLNRELAKDEVSILYGNMMKDRADGVMRDRCFNGNDITMLGFYTGTLNHSPAYIRRDLFDKYGLYDESLRIVSDWKWYLQAIILVGEKPVYTDIDVTLFDMTGISETNKTLERDERERVLSEVLPSAILADYKRWSFEISQMQRLQRHKWAYRLVWFLERCLFKIEKL